MRQVLVVVLVIVLCAAGSSMAFDGMRKGFVLGGGLGLAPTSSIKFGIYDESAAGLGLNFVIGGAFNEQNMLVYEGNVTSWKADVVDASIAQGFNGVAWYHYFGPLGKSAFATIGLGAYVFSADGYEDNEPGFGFLIGGGYEFSKHWQVGAYLASGTTSDADFSQIEYDHTHFSILVSGIAF